MMSKSAKCINARTKSADRLLVLIEFYLAFGAAIAHALPSNHLGEFDLPKVSATQNAVGSSVECRAMGSTTYGDDEFPQ